jgi:dihydrofolate synthase/folylpolyglutamate synthase
LQTCLPNMRTGRNPPADLRRFPLNPAGSFKSLADWLPWLETLSPREIVLGLERVQAVLARLQLARPPLVISVAGTNGKGSSVAMLEALLRDDGRKTGCYTSPHVSVYNERIRIDGEAASDAQVLHALQQVEAARDDVPLTYFEFGTLAALVAFDTAAVDTQILEVGMGGRLDAVNAVEPDACLITNVSLDHCAWLGNDVESIAVEKAGIMRHGKPVIFGSQIVPAAIRAHASDIGARLVVAGTDFNYQSKSAADSAWTWQGQNTELQGLLPPALAGNVQLQNAAAVLALIEALNLGHLLQRETVDRALSSLRLAGRFQLVSRRQTWILDVAHNRDSAKALAESLASMPGEPVTFTIVGMLADKDVESIVAPLEPLVGAWIAVTVEGSRAANAAKLATKIANQTHKPCLVCGDISQALQYASEHTGEGDKILITGSFYIVGPTLDWLRQ